MSWMKVANATTREPLYKPLTESKSPLKKIEQSRLPVISRKAKETNKRRSLPQNKMIKLFPLFLILSVVGVVLAAPHRKEIQGDPYSDKPTALKKSEVRETSTRQFGCLPLGTQCLPLQCCRDKEQYCIIGRCKPCNRQFGLCGGVNGVLGPCCSGLYCILGTCKPCGGRGALCGLNQPPCCSGPFNCSVGRCL